MAGLLEYFMTELVPTLKLNNIVDINELVEIWRNQSPITLKYNRETFISVVPSAILANLCTNYQDQGTFVSQGLLALHSILNEEVNENSIAKWCLSIHLTKISDTRNHGAKLSYLLSRLIPMVVKAPEENHQQWIKLAKSVMKHSNIRAIVDSNICKFGVEPKDVTEIDISIVSNSVPELKGFSGVDQIYIHSTYFESKFESSYTKAAAANVDDERVEVAAKMSIIALVIHEFGHVKFRLAYGDFNVNTPKLAKEKGLPDDSKEMGVLCEVATFGSHVDWNQSQFLADVEYMKTFIYAIENGSELPKGPNGIIINREPSEPVASGVDMDVYVDYE